MTVSTNLRGGRPSRRFPASANRRSVSVPAASVCPAWNLSAARVLYHRVWTWPAASAFLVPYPHGVARCLVKSAGEAHPTFRWIAPGLRQIREQGIIYMSTVASCTHVYNSPIYRANHSAPTRAALTKALLQARTETTHLANSRVLSQ